MSIFRFRYVPRLAILSLSALIASTTAAESPPQKFRLGFIAPFSGAAQLYGDSARNGFELALDETGRNWIDVIYENDEFRAAKTVAAFHKLTSVDKVDAVICVASTPCNAVAPLAQQLKVPLFAWASDPKVSRHRKFVVRTYPSGDDEGKRVAEEALINKATNLALIVSANDYSDSWRQGFTANFPAKEITLNEEVPNDSKDFRALVLRAHRKHISQFSICLDPGQSAAFAKQAREQIQDIKIFGCESLHDKAEAMAASGALDSAWFATITVTDKFKNQYIKRFGNDSAISGAANHYDLAYFLKEALAEGGPRDILSRIITGRERVGAVGTLKVSDTNGDRHFDIALDIKKVQALQ